MDVNALWSCYKYAVKKDNIEKDFTGWETHALHCMRHVVSHWHLRLNAFQAWNLYFIQTMNMVD